VAGNAPAFFLPKNPVLCVLNKGNDRVTCDIIFLTLHRLNISMLYGYISPKLIIRPCPQKEGLGVYALQAIAVGELLCVWGGRAVPASEFSAITDEQKCHSLQVAEDVYLVTDAELEPVDFFNHSCDPNAGLRGQICLVGMRLIAAGEEVCFDYAMSDGSPYDEFICTCGSSICRGRVSGDDWKRPDIQQRYAGYFSPYIQQRIDGLHK
jgi:hypothetical protein